MTLSDEIQITSQELLNDRISKTRRAELAAELFTLSKQVRKALGSEDREVSTSHWGMHVLD